MALIRLRDRIRGGLGLNAKDSTTLGDKYTHCTWGLCSRDKEQWPDAGDHLFPVDFMDRGRVAPKYGCRCPLQLASEKDDLRGCFWRCRVFRRDLATPTREEALELFEEKIYEAGDLPEVCACDGTGELIDPIGGKKKLPCPDCRPETYRAWRKEYPGPWAEI